MSPQKNPIRVALAMMLVAAMILAVFSPAQAQPPSNDIWEEATVIASLPYDIWQDTSEATSTSDEPVPSCWYGWFDITNTVWYAYTPTSPQYIRASMGGSYYASTLAVFTHSDSGFTQIYCTRLILQRNVAQFEAE